MIVDTSAIIAILKADDDAAVYAQALATAEARRLSAAGYLECGTVLDSRRDPIISRGLDDLLEEAELVIQPVTERQARLARAAHADFGKGSGHPAGLNFGDAAEHLRGPRVRNFGDEITEFILKQMGITYDGASPRHSELVVTGSILEHLPRHSWAGTVCGVDHGLGCAFEGDLS